MQKQFDGDLFQTSYPIHNKSELKCSKNTTQNSREAVQIVFWRRCRRFHSETTHLDLKTCADLLGVFLLLASLDAHWM